jgi:hypothetical protein
MPVIQTPKPGYRIMRDELADYGNLIRKPHKSGLLLMQLDDYR